MRRVRGALAGLAGVLALSSAWAQDPGASAEPSRSASVEAPPPPAKASAEPGPSASAEAPPSPAKKESKDKKPEKVLESCRENIPEGAVRPTLRASVEPTRGTSGHAVWLAVTVEHGAGEHLLPEGFAVTGGSDAVEVLEEAFWFIPDPKGGSVTTVEGPSDEQRAKESTVESRARIPFVPLPENPGTNMLRLPAIPIVVARANGQVMTLCTQPIDVVVDDPIVNEVEPAVRPNPPPRPQREEWQSLVRTLRTFAFLLPLLIAVALLTRWWVRRPKPAPPKPQIPPWITAMREIDEVRRSGWLDEEKLNEYFDRVDDITRFYLGERYGFDGLESTTPEIEDALSRVYPPLDEPERIRKFLGESDFVKYAEVTPTRDDCLQAIDRAEAIVRSTMPRSALVTAPDKKKKKKAKRAA